MPRICFDRILPKDLLTGTETVAIVEGQTARAAFERKKLWEVRQTLRVAFLEGTKEQQEMVRRFAPEWSEFGGITFDFVNNAKPHIRITFNPDDGAWSNVGRDCETVPRTQPTMNLGWVDQGVILHEFGHALGMIHEHENPLGGIKWNKEAVYRDLGGPPNRWDRATVEANMFTRYARGQVNATVVDKLSIMLYEIPKEWTLDGFSSTPNDVLSVQDKAFIGNSKNYPLAGPRQA